MFKEIMGDLMYLASRINLQGGDVSALRKNADYSNEQRKYNCPDDCDCHDGDCSDCICVDCNNCED